MAQTRTMDHGRRRAPVRADTVLSIDTQWYDPAVTVVTVGGVIDAANVDTFVETALDRAMLCCSMIVDMRGVRYLSVSGFEALRLLDGRCALADTRWTVIPSSAVRRLLRRFDLAGQVPTTASLEQAFAAAQLHVPIVQFAGPDGDNRTA
ncbi:STAS domain-containing protein [Mycolicibacterium sp. 120266]|jgi:anti-anti-sigma regulatory factor|uniref:STAS domain-containing protein n=1 Tax=Mycolicibacterium sp. 120266 TaxID=3090601 RepID=UPI00299E93E1|nr:STAS domain-containing protein [Mycolicibacterium sp. 120266]MDX1873401.1 STAS domain-containing protein [Mycolicibacterium sp. 120266]